MAKTYKKLFDTSAFEQPKQKAPALPVAPKRVAVTEIPLVKQSLQRPVATTAPVKSVYDVPTRLGESKVPLTQAERKKLFQRDVKAVSTPAGAFAYGAASAIGSPVKSIAKMKGYKETPEEIALREASRKQVLTPTMDVSRGMTKTPTMIQGRKTTYGQLGEMAGTVAPFMAVESAVSKGLTKAVPTIGALTKTGIAGAVSGGGLTGLESAGEGKTPIEVAKDAAVGSIIGAGANVGLGALGKAITKAKSGVRPTALEQGLIAREYNIPRSEVPEVLQRVQAETTQSVAPTQRAIAETQRGTTQTFTSVREGKTPKLQVPKGQRRFTQSSVQKSKLIPEEVKTAYQEVPLHYKQLVNKETFENAVKNVEKTDFNTAVNNFVRKEALKTADDTAEGIALITKAVKNNDIQLVRELTADMAVKSTKAGQAVQALSILSRLDPEGMLVFAERQINKAVESAPKSAVSKAKNIVDDVRKIAADETITNKDEAIKELFKRNNLKPPTKPEVDVEKEVFKQLKLPKLSNDDVQAIITAMNNAKNLEGRAKQIEIAKAVQTISDNIPAEKGEKIKALARISMLANPKTLLARNPLGNLVFGTLENVASVPSGVADVLTSKVMGTARQTPVLPAVGAGAKGFVRGGKELAEDIRLGIDTSVTRGGAEIPMSKRVFENKLLNKANNWLSNALMIGDRPFYEAAYDQRIKELTKLRGLDKPTKEIEQDAMNFAKDRVFQSDSVTAKALGEIKRGLNTANIKGYGLGDVAIPFLKTPANIIEKGVAYTPIGVLNVIRRWPTKTKIANEAFDQKLFTDAIGRFMTGTGIAALGYNMARGGQITGKSKDDPENLKALKKTAGIQDYSIKIGDKWVSFDWAQPAAIPLAVGIDLYNAGVKETDALKMIEKGMVSGGDTLFNQSVLKGVSQMMGGFSPTEGLAQTVSGAPGMFVPTLLGQTARATDPYKRTAETPIERMQLKVPELRKRLEPKIGVFGEPLKETGGEITPEKLVNIFINPANVSKDVSDPTTQELFRLYKDTGETSFLPKSKIESFTYKGEYVKLTKEQKTTFKTEIGTRTKSQLDSLMSSGDYQIASDDEKAKMASNVIRDVYAQVKDEFITAMGK